MELKRKSGTLLQDFTAIFNREGNCITASKKWNQLFNIKNDPRGENLEDIVGKEHSEQFLKHFSKSIELKISSSFPFTMELPNETHDAYCTMKPWFLEEEIFGGIILVLEFEDSNFINKIENFSSGISDPMEINKEISYNILVENMRNMVCLHKPDGTYYYVSPSFEEVLGYPPGEMIGKNPYDFFHPDDIENIREKAHTPSLAGEEENEIEYRFRHKEGYYLWIHSLTRPLKDEGDVYALQTDSYPIQERKELEIRLRQSEAQFRGAFEHSAIGMAIVALNGSWIKTNQRLRNMLGYNMDELSNMTFQDITHPHDLKVDLDLLKELVSGKRKNYQMEKRYFHKNGQIVWALLAVSMVRDQAGEPKHFISQIMDISERKKAEKELKQLLDLTKDQNDRLVNFAHIVSHNLRSHSSNIKMLLELLDEETDEQERLSIIKMLNKASSNLESTIQNLNGIVTKKSYKQLDLEDVPLRKCIDKATANLEAFILKNYAIIVNEVDENLSVRANAAYLDSILLNLITNAIKYSKPDQNPKVRFTAKKLKDKVRLFVKDNGMGIDLDKHENEIFNLYQTFHGNNDAKGIGLFITKNQIEAMGGKITVESEPDEGTEFILDLLKN